MPRGSDNAKTRQMVGSFRVRPGLYECQEQSLLVFHGRQNQFLLESRFKIAIHEALKTPISLIQNCNFNNDYLIK
jgi:hypothetical protein